MRLAEENGAGDRPGVPGLRRASPRTGNPSNCPWERSIRCCAACFPSDGSRSRCTSRTVPRPRRPCTAACSARSWNSTVSSTGSCSSRPTSIRPNVIADPQLHSYARQFFETVAVEADRTVPDRVSDLIEALLPTGRCSAEQVARSLGVDRRTVHRRLADSGLTFSALLRAKRAQLADQLLANPRLSMTEISGRARLHRDELVLALVPRGVRVQPARMARARERVGVPKRQETSSPADKRSVPPPLYLYGHQSGHSVHGLGRWRPRALPASAAGSAASPRSPGPAA